MDTNDLKLAVLLINKYKISIISEYPIQFNVNNFVDFNNNNNNNSDNYNNSVNILIFNVLIQHLQAKIAMSHKIKK
jgi:hypothetical protein